MRRESRTDHTKRSAVATAVTGSTGRIRVFAMAFFLLWAAVLLIVSSAHAETLLPPNIDDTYADRLTYTTESGSVYSASSFAIDAEGRLWVAHNSVPAGSAGVAVYPVGSTTPTEFYDLGARYITSCDFDEGGRLLYLTNTYDAEIFTFDTSLAEPAEVESFFFTDEDSSPTDIEVVDSNTIFLSDSVLKQVLRVDLADPDASLAFDIQAAGLFGVRGIGAGDGYVLVGDSVLGNKFARYDFNGNFVSNTTVPAWGIGSIRDMYVDKFNTTYVLSESASNARFGRLSSSGANMGVYPVPAEGTLTGSTKLVVDAGGYAWVNSVAALSRGVVQRYEFHPGAPDTTAPTTTDDAPDVWAKAPLNVTLTATDEGGSGVAHTYYSLDGSYPSIATTGAVAVSTEGTSSLKYFSVDSAGNTETVHTKQVRVDAHAPVSSADVDPIYYGAVHIDLSAMDALSGVKEIWWRLNGGAWVEGNAVDLSTAERGDFVLEYYAVDNAGNSELPVHESFFTAYTHYEQNAAQITYRSTWTTATAGMWSGGSYARSASSSAAAFATFTGNVIEVYGPTGPDLGNVRLRLDGGTPIDVDLYSETPTLVRLGRFTGVAGTHVLTIEALGTKNSASSGTAIGVDYFDVGGVLTADTTPPTTTDDTHSGWYNALSTVTLTALDDSYVAQTLYRVATGPVQTYAGPFTLAADGSTSIQYRSIDGRGNSETTKTATVLVDSQAPVTSADLQASYIDSGTVHFSATDNLSGVSTCQYNLDDAGWVDGNSVYVTGYGSHSLLYRALDVAGNVESTHTTSVRIRRAVETYTITSPELDWNGYWTTYGSAKITGNSSTNNYVTGYGRSTGMEVWAYKHRTAGIARLYIDGHVYYTDLYTNSDTAVLTKVFDSGTLPDVDHFFMFGASGTKNANATGRNVNFHSVEVEGVFGGWVDDSEPAVTTSNIPAGWTSSPFSVVLTQDDYLDHEGAIFYDTSRVETDAPDATTEYTEPFPVSEEGTTYVSFYSVDLFGNTEVVQTKQLRLDSTPPSTSCDATQTYTNSAEIHFEATDALSGVGSTFFKIDESAWTTGTTAALPTGSAGTHTLQWYSVDTVGNQEPVQSTTFTVLRRFEEETQASVEQDGMDWGHESYYLHSAEIVRYAWGPGALAGTFTGDRFDLIAAKRPGQGIAQIIIDGVEVGLCDQYASTDLFQQRVFSKSGLGEGVHTFRVAWTGTQNPDATGSDINVDAFELLGTMIGDTVPPTSAATADGEWRTTPEAVTITAHDNGVVAPVVRYRLNGDGEHIYTSPFTVTDEGTTTIEYWATDGVGNEESPHNFTQVRIDRTAPVVTHSAPPTWVLESQTVTMVATDLGVGVESLTYSLNGGDPLLSYPEGGIGITAEGLTTVRYRATDYLGNTVLSSFDVRIDHTAPSSVSDVPTGWISPRRAVTLTGSDGQSGLARIDYSLDGAPASRYDGPFTITSEGVHTLQFHATDGAGNVEATQTVSVNVDATAPTTGNDAPSGWSLDTVLLHFTPVDALSGVFRTLYSLDGSGPAIEATAATVISAEGTTTARYLSIDSAGNTETVKTALVRIDRIKPTTVASAPAGWSPTPVNVLLSATDSGSGVAGIRYSVNGSAAATYTTGVNVSAQGTSTVSFASVDVAGNRESTQSVSVRVDTTKPVTTSDAPSGWQAQNTTITLSAADTGSGVARSFYRIGASEAVTYTAPFVVTAEGTTTVSFWSVDGVGNTETTKTATVLIDKTTPFIQGTVTNQGTPLSGVLVTAYNSTTSASVKSVLTNASGVYGMFVPAGNYKIRFTNTTPTFLSQYYNHKTTMTDATVVSATSGKVTVSSDLGPTIQGTMTNQGVPLVGILVTAFDATTHASVKSVVTDSNGQFVMPVAVGSYHVRYTNTVPASLSQYFDHKVTISDATTLTALGGITMASSDLGPTIQGVLTNEGVPLSGVVVAAFNASTHASVKSVSTNAAGAYSMSVPVGSYHLRFYVAANPALTQYHDHKASIDAANVVNAPGGVVTVSSDLGPTIQGTLTNQGVPIPGAIVAAFNATSHASVRSVSTNASGTYSMSLPSGAYHIRFVVSGQPSLTQFYDHKSSINDATVTTATAGLINVSSDLGPTIQGAVTNDGAPLSGVLVTAFDATSHASIKTVATNPSGNYTMSVPTGAYHIRFSVSSPASLTQYYDHGTSINDSAIVTATAGIVPVSSDLGPVIRGTLTNNGVPLSGVLVTVFDSVTHGSIKSVTTNAQGYYSVPVSIGSYHLRFSVASLPGLNQYYDRKTAITDATVVDATGGAIGISSDLGALP